MSGTDQTSKAGADAPIPVPSGQTVTLIDTIWNERGPNGLAVRFRFLAPAITKGSGTVSADQAQDDMLALCKSYALPRLGDATGPKPAQIIISLSDQVVPFGEAHPEATQFFDSFDYKDGDCVWSLF
jgi:hypothetical protein